MFGLIETGHVQSFDAAGLTMWRNGAELARPLGPGWLSEAVRDYTALGSALLRNIFALGALVALFFLERRREAVLFFATVCGGWALSDTIKLLVQRPRPMIVPHLVHAGGSSFPSAHSFNAAVVYITMALAFSALSQRRAVRLTLIASAVVLTVLVALSRVWLGVHNPSDVIAGWLGGAGWALLASAILTERDAIR
ncbi:PA-phosphatase-like phosphoesterase [Novosphingobium sp. Rr 2-17]|nr:PA-phosphatase-like phosphoesterase [Novosphingobium sp. Rr 2-17]